MSDLHDVLELCLQELERGTDIETLLFRYPAFADELRPILEAAAKAIMVPIADPSVEVIRRNRAKVLQHAAQMRESKLRSSRRLWSVPLRRALVALAVIAALFLSSNGLVRAATTTLPGDQLYPVKRTWEDVRVLFTFNLQSRAALEVEHENERLQELSELFAQGRSVQVDFSGLVTRQNADLWLVSGIPIAISTQTVLPSQEISVGSAVHVIGVTQQDGAVLAQSIELLPAGVALPEVNDDDASEIEERQSGESNQGSQENSGQGSVTATPQVETKQTPETESESQSGSSSSSEPKEASVKGTVQSINGNIVVVSGQIMNVSSAKIEGTPRVGASVKVEGYYDSNGLFIVTKIEFESGDSNDGTSKSGSDDDSKKSGEDDSKEDGGGGSSGPGGGSG